MYISSHLLATKLDTKKSNQMKETGKDICDIENYSQIRVNCKHFFRSVVQQKYSILNWVLKLNLQKKIFFVQINQDRKIQKLNKLLEKVKELLLGKKKFSFGIMLEQWMTSEYALWHPNIIKVLRLAAPIPPSTAEVECTFSLMKLICTWAENALVPKIWVLVCVFVNRKNSLNVTFKR